MNQKRKILLNVISLIIAITSCFTLFAITSSAVTSSNGTSTRTIKVVTKANWWIPGSESITISQTKGIRKTSEFNIWKMRYVTKETKDYGSWIIRYYSSDNKHSGTVKLTGSKVKINLKPDKTYTIIVSWDSSAELNPKNIVKGSFSTLPTWKVSSTYKVSECY